MELDDNNISESESESQESFVNKDKYIKTEDIIEGLIDSINYAKSYFTLKESNNEKYIILFTDIFNTYKITDEIINNNIDKLKEEKNITFLLVGKNKRNELKHSKNNSFYSDEEIKITQIIIEKYGEKSELIDFENMKKIKNILSSNNVIKDEIIYPNEIYK